MRIRRLAAVVLIALSLLCLVVPAEASKTVKVSASKRLSYQGARGDTLIEGDVRIEYGDTVINSARAIVNIEARTARIMDSVVLTKGDVRLTADSMDADFRKEIVTVSGRVRLEKREQQQEKDEKGNPKVEVIVMTAKSIKISIDTEDFLATGDVVITKDGQKATADKAEYVAAKKSMTLAGSVFVQGREGETIKADTATLFTDREGLEAEGEAIEIVFTIND